MKKIMILALVVCSTSVMAEFSVGGISDFSGSYLSPSGKATASNWKFNGLNYSDPVEIEVQEQAGSLYFSIDNDEFEFDQLPKELEELESIDWNAFNLNSNGQVFQINLGSLKGRSFSSSDGQSIDLKKLNVKCVHISSTEERTVSEEFLDSCLNNSGNLSIDSVVAGKSGKMQSVSSIDFKINKNALNFSLKAKGIKLKGNGEIYFDGKSIKVKINKAKAGIFSVKGKLFKELEKQESDKLIVNNPWIEFILD